MLCVTDKLAQLPGRCVAAVGCGQVPAAAAAGRQLSLYAGGGDPGVVLKCLPSHPTQAAVAATLVLGPTNHSSTYTFQPDLQIVPFSLLACGDKSHPFRYVTCRGGTATQLLRWLAASATCGTVTGLFANA